MYKREHCCKERMREEERRMEELRQREEELRRREQEAEAQQRREEEARRGQAKAKAKPARRLADDAFDLLQGAEDSDDDQEPLARAAKPGKKEKGKAGKAKPGKPKGSHVDNAFAFLAGACEEDGSEDDGDEAWEAAILSLQKEQKPKEKAKRNDPSSAARSSAAAPKRKPARTGAWVQKAFLALGCDKDDSDESDEDASPPEQKRSADFQLVKLAGAIAKKIDDIHND
ncbi:BARD1 [Symbiodinium natans]|uniref:BARD1 protein n=1 Tax=Symbiodinium natans TaxID=878477 RepID=A0A812L1F5_9DINO|nr:BARD1 [Symbiodinium natans]